MVPLWLALTPALCVLAIGPLIWLGRSWADDPSSLIPFAALLLLGASGLSSPLVRAIPRRDRIAAVALLGATAVVRLAGELLAIRTIGALALVADVAALSLALGLRHRSAARSPLGLASLFALSLPVTRIVERAAGYPLQLLSADCAGALLGLFRASVTVEGTALRSGGATLSVDLPCSGAASVVQLLLVWSVLVASRRITGLRAALGWTAAITGALAANTVRLAAIAEAITAGWDASAEPLHSSLGLLGLAVGAAPLLALARSARPTSPANVPLTVPSTQLPIAAAAPLALVASILAIAVTRAPSRPIDVVETTAALHLPSVLAGHAAGHVPLSPAEEAYFTQWGGLAEKRRYGPHDVTVVRTSAPLRHLHSPAECLGGAGYRVELRGVRGGSDPAAVYRAIDPSGLELTVTVRYFASDGARATSPAEASWHWLRAPGATWTMIARSTPAAIDGDGASIDASLAHLLDLQPSIQPRLAHAARAHQETP